MSNRFAHGLRGAGVEQNAPVCLMMPNAWEMFISQYGVHKLGAMAVQINADFRGPALARMINLTESELLLVHETLVPAVENLRASFGFSSACFVAGADAPRTVAGVAASSWETLILSDR